MTGKTDYLDMTDDDFLKISHPVKEEVVPSESLELSITPETVVEEPKAEDITPAVVSVDDDPDDETVLKTPVKTKDAVDESAIVPADNSNDESTVEWKEYESDKSKSDEENATAKAEHNKTKPEAITKPDEKNPDGTPKDALADADTNKDRKVEEKSVDYEDFFKQIMKPFKANGREVKLNTPEEAIRMMQMGAGYGRKLQDLQPHLKTIRMLEKNKLLDADRISYLIDLDQHNPEAIKKLIKESGIDPLDLNTEDAVTYRPTNRTISDSELNFDNTLKEITSLPTGKETVKIINDSWDDESKKVLWESPEILGVIQSQRELGIYDQITAEIDRQKLLGTIPNSSPFLEAYKVAGDYLTKNELMQLPETPSPVETTKVVPTVLATRAAQVKPQVNNSEKAKAAASTVATPRKASTVVNPLDMADEDFLKQFNGRI